MCIDDILIILSSVKFAFICLNVASAIGSRFEFEPSSSLILTRKKSWNKSGLSNLKIIEELFLRGLAENPTKTKTNSKTLKMESVHSETDQIKKLSIGESNDEDEEKGEEDDSLSRLDIFSADFDPAAAIYCPDLVFFFCSNENINSTKFTPK